MINYKLMEIRVVGQAEYDTFMLVQQSSEVEQYNNEYSSDYNYYFIESDSCGPVRLWGCYYLYFDAEMEFVANL